jgi:hypothetical protein
VPATAAKKANDRSPARILPFISPLLFGCRPIAAAITENLPVDRQGGKEFIREGG